MRDTDIELLDQNLPGRIADLLATEILRGTYEDGARLSEEEIAKRFGTSRTPVREALRLLERDGLVTIEPRRGAHANSIGAAQVANIYICRAYLYGLAARLAALRATSGDIKRLRGILATMRETAVNEDTQGYAELNVKFHKDISSIAENESLSRMIEQLGRVTMRLRFLSITLPGRLEKSLAEHERIMEAIASRDHVGAEQIVRELIAGAGEELLASHYQSTKLKQYVGAVFDDGRPISSGSMVRSSAAE